MKLKDFDFRVWYGEKYLKQKYNKGRFGYCERGYAVGFVGDRHKLVYEIIQGIDSNEYGDNDYEWIYDLDLDENDCEVELWTGLHDKNNQKIYEGDIVSFIKGKAFVRYFLTESKFAFCVEQGGMFFLIEELRKLNASEYEVVGNIHENSELLKSKDSK